MKTNRTTDEIRRTISPDNGILLSVCGQDYSFLQYYFCAKYSS